MQDASSSSQSATVTTPVRKQAKGYVFTLNNPNGFRPHFDPDLYRTLVYQLERGESGTEHLQGYLEFKSKRTLAGAKRLFGANGVHLEVRKGTRAQAIEYSRKVETRIDGPWEFGDMDLDTQGKRKDLIVFRDRVMDSDLTFDEIVLE